MSIDYFIINRRKDFVLWADVVHLMEKGEHLTKQGFEIILRYYAAINREAGWCLKIY